MENIKLPDYAITVNGDAMAPVLNDGDTALIEYRTDEVPDGTLVAVETGDGIVIGWAYKINGEAWLVRKNGKPFIIQYADILGEVVGSLWRK